jgi:hypothetical protein
MNAKKILHSLAVAKGITASVAPKLPRDDAERLAAAGQTIASVIEKIRHEAEKELLKANGQQDLFPAQAEASL